MPFLPKKILVATDFSDDANQALEAAIDLADAFHAQLTLFHVAMPSTYIDIAAGLEASAANTLVYQDAVRADLEKGQKELLERTRRRGYDAEWRLAFGGQPALQIVNTAREGGFGAVVMGTLGQTGLKHLLLGSVAEAVVRHCAVPVLTVRHPRLT
jgi:nucleotide-binding universal stress UspA family protein